MRRPWNIPDHPVYSLATYQDDRVNMNICTYVVPVSRKPKLYAVAVDPQSFTYSRLQSGGVAVLQLLGASQAELIRQLGKRSGGSFDKHRWLENRGLLTRWRTRAVLSDAVAWLELSPRHLATTGDHELFLCTVEASRSLREDGVLMFQQLVEEGWIL